MDKIHEQFVNPDIIYRPAPFWTWNEDMDAEETVRQLKNMKEHGMGGGFAHVRLGLVTPYLQEEFMDVWKKTLEGAKELGMKLYIYDENNWPSGRGGGLVEEKVPDILKPRCAIYRIVSKKNARVLNRDEKDHAKLYHLYAYDEATKTIGRDLINVPDEEWGDDVTKIFQIYTEVGHSYADMSNPDVVKAFIETTHEEYKKRFKDDFGGAIPALFSDEANLDGNDRDIAVFSTVVEDKFREMHGYELGDNLPLVFGDYNGDFDRSPTEVRFDFNSTMCQLWIDSFVKQMADWCEQNGLKWTGHDHEHTWPQCKGTYSEQRTYMYRQWPGVDWLLCDALRVHPQWNDLLILAQVRSAANQFNKERVLCEAYGAAGWHSTFRDYKRIGDWLLVNGINLFSHHLTHYSIIGSRKRDCPQTFDWREPWWDEYADYNNYLTRASYLLSQGKMEQRILLMDVATTGFMVPCGEQQGMLNHTFTPDAIKNPDVSDFLRVLLKINEEQWDYDIGEEFTVAEQAKVVGNKLVIGQQEYSVVILTQSMLNVTKGVAAVLLEFMANGGIVLSRGGDCARYINGKEGTQTTEMLRAAWTEVDSPKAVHDALCGILPRRIFCNKKIPEGVSHMRRVLEDGRHVYFFANHSLETFNGKITIYGDKIAKWDLFTGEKIGVEYVQHDGMITFDLDLEWTQSAMFVVGEEAEIPALKPAADVEAELKTVSIKPEKPNNLLLDHCKLVDNGEETPVAYYHQIQQTLFKARGLKKDLWTDFHLRDEIQQWNARFTEGDGSGFEVVYNFTVLPGAKPCDIRAIVELPQLIKLRVNGNEVEWKGDGYYLDRNMGSYDITPYVREGENELVLWNTKFDIRNEIEAVILDGDFSIEIVDDRFVVAKSLETFEYGSWYKQGYKFYPNAFRYNYEVELAKKPENAKLVVGKYDATAVSVFVNGEYAGIVGKDGDMYAQIEDFLKEGKNEISVRACASFRNLYGPHLNYRDDTVATWGEFENYRKNTVHGASEYSQLDYGLYEAPKLYVNK